MDHVKFRRPERQLDRDGNVVRMAERSRWRDGREWPETTRKKLEAIAAQEEETEA